MSFFNKNIYDDHKIKYLFDRLFVSNQNLILNIFKLFKISGFSMFKKNLEFQIFLKVPGKVATLMIL